MFKIYPNGHVKIPQKIRQLTGITSPGTISVQQAIQNLAWYIEGGGKSDDVEKAFEQMKRYLRHQSIHLNALSLLHDKVDVHEGSRLKAQGILQTIPVLQDKFLRLCVGEERLELPMIGFLDGKYNLVLSPKRISSVEER